MTNLADIDGIGPSYERKLKELGITTAEKLLERGQDRSGRREIAEAIEARDNQVLRWVNVADLFRITGLTMEWIDLLSCCGVDSVPELAQRSSARLHQRIPEVNEIKKITRRLPTEAQVTAWVAQAKTLGRIVTL